MKTKLSLLFLFCLQFAFSQSPQQINYQGMARDSVGMPLRSTAIKLKFAIRQGSQTGTVVFTEEQSITTSALGLFSTQIGKNTPLNGISWQGDMYLQIGIDPLNGTNYIDLGSQQILSVPFAFHANDVPVNYTDSTNIISIGSRTVQLKSANSFTYAAGGGIAITSGSIINTSPDVPVNLSSGNANINISGAYPNFTVASSPSLNISGQNLSISGSNTILLPTTSLVGTGAAAVIPLGPNSYSLDVPQVTITPGNNNVNVTGNYPSFTVSASPSLSILSPNTLSITNGNSVALPNYSLTQNSNSISLTQNGTVVATTTLSGAVNLTYTNNQLSAGTNTVTLNSYTNGSGVIISGSGPIYTISALSQSITVTGSGAAQVTPTSGVNFNVDVPLTNIAVTSSVGAATVVATGTNNFNINMPPPVFDRTTSILTTGTNSTTISPTLSINSNILSVGPSTNNIVIPTPVYNQLTGELVTAGQVAVITPTLALNSGVLTVGPPSNTIALPGSVPPNISQGGIINVASSGNSFTVSAPAPAYNHTTSVLSTGSATTLITPSLGLTGSVLSVGPSSNTIALPPQTPPVISQGGIVNVTSSGNSFTVSAPGPVYTSSTSVLSNGTATTLITPTLALSGNVLSVGPSGNTITLPAQAPPVISQGGIVNVASSGNSFTVSAPAPVYTQSNSALVTGTASTIISPSLALSGNTLSVGPSANNIQLPTPVYNATTSVLMTGGVPTTISPILQLSGNVLSVGPSSNTIALPAQTPPVISQGGIVNVASSGNSFTVSAPGPVYTSSTSVLSNGTATTLITPTLALSGNVLSVGPSGNTITLPAQAPPVISQGGIVTVASSGNSFTVSAPAPVYTQSNSALVTGTASTIISPSLALSGNTLSVGPSANNIQLPTPVYNATTSVLMTGGVPTTISPTLQLSGNVLSIGPSSNTIALPAQTTPTLYQSGSASITSSGFSHTVHVAPTLVTSTTGVAVITSPGTNTFFVNVPAPVFTPTNSQLSVGSGTTIIAPTLSLTGNVLSVGPSTNNITLPTPPNATLTPGGIVSINSSGNTFTVSAPAPAYTKSTSALTTGTSSTLIEPQLAISGNILSVGPSTNNIALPTPTITGAGIAVVSPTVGGTYVVTVPQTTFAYNNTTGSLTSGSNSVYITPPLMLSGNTLRSGPASNTVTLNSYTSGTGINITGGPDYTINATAQTTSITAGSNNNINVTGSAPSYTLDAPTYTISFPLPNVVQISNGVNTSTVNIPTYTAGNGLTLSGGPANMTISANTTGTNAVWSTLGNAGTNSVTNFIGTTDNAALRFKVNNQNSGIITPTGSTFFGYQSGSVNTASTNSGFGQQALAATTSGEGNTASGNQALAANITGFYNTGIGYHALQNNTGDGNTAVGKFALVNNTTGFQNVAVGANALVSNLTGFYNTAIGVGALLVNTGSHNTATGHNALNSNTSGIENTAFGRNALFSNTTGHNNTSVGYEALRSNTTGYSNVALGIKALYSNTTKGNLVAVGDSALFNNGIGASVATDATGNTAVGSKALFSNTTGYQNTANGYRAMFANTTGSMNTATGYQALQNNTTGSGNAAFGRIALFANTTGIHNSAYGFSSMNTNTTGEKNTAMGWFSMSGNTTGNYNAGYGSSALFSNTTGDGNSGIGMNANYSNTSGNNNTALGANTGYNNTTGSGNVYIGANAGYSETGSNKLYIANNSTTTLLYGDFTNGRIGINTTTLGAYDLNIYNPGTSSALRFNNSGSTGLGFTIGNNTTSSNLLSYENTPMNFGNNGVNQMVLSANGNLGINTIAPTATLQVNGTFRVVDGTQGASKVMVSDASGNASWQASSFVPPGTVMAYAGSTAPAGWAVCDGSTVLRVGTYANLFAAIGENWGSGDGSTTFHLPDMRGMFLRGVDGTANNDPDKGSRTAVNPGGNTGNNVGSEQTDIIKSHTHPINNLGSQTNYSTLVGGTAAYNGGGTTATQPHSGSGTETRPKNVYVIYMIKI